MSDLDMLGSVIFCLVVLAFLLVGVLQFEKLMLETKKWRRRASFQQRPLPRAVRSNRVVHRGR
jgi:hypothetical protein